MNIKTRLGIAVVATCLVASAAPGIAFAQHLTARITMADARTRALRVVPGTVRAEELEFEHGRTIYSFEIRVNGAPADHVTEVNIDANDGSVVSIEHENG